MCMQNMTNCKYTRIGNASNSKKYNGNIMVHNGNGNGVIDKNIINVGLLI